MFTAVFKNIIRYDPAAFRRYFYAVLISTSGLQVDAAPAPDPGDIFENNACVECHEKHNPQLISDWQASVHASTQPVTDCVACHGKLHKTAASSARRDTACIDCHGGKKAPAVHSYASSKHGVIMQLEKNSYDWQQPLAMANYRAPGCSYCHLHEGGHNVNRMMRSTLMEHDAADKIQLQVRRVCQDCHAPRYITRLLTNGEDMLEIGRKKVREAQKLIDQAAEKFGAQELAPAREIMLTMQQHLNNVYLGAAHQSPDYQWWYGQPALDGDLLRIKGQISQLYRQQNTGSH